MWLEQTNTNFLQFDLNMGFEKKLGEIGWAHRTMGHNYSTNQAQPIPNAGVWGLVVANHMMVQLNPIQQK